jgi:hypothetical protein
VVGAMAMLMYELFSYIEKRTTGWAHRSSQGEEGQPETQGDDLARQPEA